MRFVFWLAVIFSADFALAASGFFSFGYGRGGTHLSDITGGQDYNTQAGSGLFLTGGAIVPISPTFPHTFEAQLGVGYIFQDDARKEENRVSWSRIPLEAIYFYRNTRELFRFGWGITYHLANRLSAKGSNASAESSFENAFGWVLAVEKIFGSSEQANNHWSLGLKYVFIDYKSNSFNKNANGDCLFFTLSALAF